MTPAARTAPRAMPAICPPDSLCDPPVKGIADDEDGAAEVEEEPDGEFEELLGPDPDPELEASPVVDVKALDDEGFEGCGGGA